MEKENIYVKQVAIKDVVGEVMDIFSYEDAQAEINGEIVYGVRLNVNCMDEALSVITSSKVIVDRMHNLPKAKFPLRAKVEQRMSKQGWKYYVLVDVED